MPIPACARALSKVTTDVQLQSQVCLSVQREAVQACASGVSVVGQDVESHRSHGGATARKRKFLRRVAAAVVHELAE